jgi:hypothetical protein
MGQFASLESIIGKVFKSVTSDGETVWFEGTESFSLYHEQDCCENVSIEDICGDLSDLVDTPILHATEDSSYAESPDQSEQWTFYHFRTIKGTVTIRFYGSSNGYYSTSVSLYKI